MHMNIYLDYYIHYKSPVALKENEEWRSVQNSLSTFIVYNVVSGKIDGRRCRRGGNFVRQSSFAFYISSLLQIHAIHSYFWYVHIAAMTKVFPQRMGGFQKKNKNKKKSFSTNLGQQSSSDWAIGCINRCTHSQDILVGKILYLQTHEQIFVFNPL